MLERNDLNALIRLVAAFAELHEAWLIDIATDDELPMRGAGGIGERSRSSRSGVRSPLIVQVRRSGLATLGED